jgi:TolB protein
MVGLSGCGNATGPQFLLGVTVSGRVERSAVVDVRVSFRGLVLDDSLVQLTAEPDTAVEFLSGTQLRFLTAGSVTLTAQAEVEAGRIEQGQLTRNVAQPPRIVFDLLSAGNRDIYSIALDGLDTIRLTTELGDDIDPTAGGGLVVFTSFRDGNAELYSVPDTGGTAVRLTISAEDETQPALSREGASLAFAANPSGVPRIWIANGDGSGAQALAPGFSIPAAIEASPGWAPSGTQLVFVSTTAGTADLFTVQTGGAPDTLRGGGDAAVEPAWSPDGSRVVFASDSTGDGELFLLVIATGQVTRLTNRAGDDGEPAWLPDGRVVYTVFGAGGPRLRWLDPARPDTAFDIPTSGEARRPAGVF